MKRSELLSIFLVTFAFKVLAALIIPVVGDETYYWLWGQNLQLSYFDHPPAVSWLTWLSYHFETIFQFLPKSLSLRLPFIIISSLTVLIWIKVAEFTNEGSDQKFVSAWMIAILFLVNPLLGIGGVIATPDVPLVFFWSLSFFALCKILKEKNVFWYSLFGLFLGLGFSSKYHIVLFVPAALIYLFVSKKFLQIVWKLVPFTVIFGLVGSFPVLMWNYLNDWQSFKFQLNHGLGHSGFEWHWSMTYFIGQILLAGPVLIFFALRQTSVRRELSLSWFNWIFFLYSSFKAPVEANWPIVAHVQTSAAVQNHQKWFKFHIGYFLALYVLFVVVLFTEWGQKKLNRIPQSMGIASVVDDVKNLKPLYGPSYQISSLLKYVYDIEIKKLPGLSRYDFYDRLHEIQGHKMEDRFFVLKHESTPWPETFRGHSKVLQKSFDYMELQIFEVMK